AKAKYVTTTEKATFEEQLPVWMDIKSGIKSANLFEVIGEAIENSVCFICFMTPEYQQSGFCKQELLYAKQCNIPITPLKLEENWLKKKSVELYNRIYTVLENQLKSSPKSKSVVKQLSSQPSEKYKMEINYPKKTANSLDEIPYSLRMMASSTSVFANSDAVNDLSGRVSRKIPIVHPHDSHRRRISPVRKIPPPVYYGRRRKKSSNDDDSEEEEQNFSKFGD
ncbi:unnamed protein product, partial [Didymodactylos carnosus]